MGTKKRIVVSFNQIEFDQKLQNLNDRVIKLNKAILLCKEITNNEVRVFDLKKVQDYLISKSDFPNLSAIADLLNVKLQYNELIALDGKKDLLQSKYITLNERGYQITDVSIKALKEVFTDYLHDDKIDTYNKLKTVSNILNKLSAKDVNALKKDVYGQYSVNTDSLNQPDFAW